MIPKFIDREKIPHKPGIYMYKNEKGEIIYVGKAVDLYSRVSSYFSGMTNSFKTSTLVENIRDIETIIVNSELEALILEANLIKKYLPTYNINLKDDKDYLYIGVTDTEFPQITTVRKQDLRNLKLYYGPFPSATTVRNTLKRLRRVFPWCSNPPGLRNKTHRPCFYLHLKLCPGACIGAIQAEDYNRIITMFTKFMEGKQEELIADLTTQMEHYAITTQFEQAGNLKKIIEGIQYLMQPTSIKQYLENPNFIADQRQKSLEQLQKDLNLPQLPERIECYDISNFQGTDATGSMVVLTNGEIDKSQYRRFKIKITGKPDDFAMHAEMMKRRLKHPEWPYPQLFLIDGGRGQVRAAHEEIQKFAQTNQNRSNIPSPSQGEGTNQKKPLPLSQTPVFGLAKREEWLYPPEGEVVKLPKRSLSLRLLQKIRDESHRFAITYHRKLRKKSSGY